MRRGLVVAPLQGPRVRSRAGLELDELLTDFRLLLVDGRGLAGADAYRYMLRRIWWAYPMYLLSNFPGLRRVFDWGYRTFTRNRARISGSWGLP